MEKFNELLNAIHNARVLRSSCGESADGKFRVHLVECEWNDIIRLADEARDELGGWIYCEEHGHEQMEPCPDCALRE